MVSCQPASPDHFFDQAVLNSNLVSDFEPYSFGKALEQYTVEYPDVPSGKRKEKEARQVVQTKIQSIEGALARVKALDAGDDEMRAIKQNSIALF
ncbi:hypothetical protein A8C56_13805 [Niabella ginsenosidivorans]|uniref:Uncharacterized protein n=1 Tax=Niabella ginsenosidivorans TaxID=1176587 RepID=A0A1A9I2R3_9BACT|nr:hypothetical protein [Niabella ginsenosidivorans]ANH81906.1 hypothetical protein A8C56_13805 [Niabella ginsenosidivorans]